MEKKPPTTQLEYLKQEISARLWKFNDDATYYGKRSERYQGWLVIISAVITILSGIKLGEWGKNAVVLPSVIVILGAVSTVLAFFGSFLAPQQCWLLNQDSYNKMRALQAEIELAELGPLFTQEESTLIDKWFKQYQGILDENNRRWLEIRGKGK